MSTKENSSHNFIPAADLSDEEKKALPFEIGKIVEFDNKNKQPKAARGHWDYIKEDPEAYLNRFQKELEYEGVNMGGYFIVKELYRDEKKDIRTSITVHLIVQPNLFPEIKEHFRENQFSFASLPDNCGFSLPYLGTIHKSLGRLNLEKFINYFYIKNTISNEAFSNWTSVPKALLKQFVDEANFAKVPEDSSEEKSKPSEDFNYLIFDEEQSGKSKAPIPLPEFREMKKKEHKSKRGLFGKKKSSSNKAENQVTENTDSALFLCLGLFNFFTTSVLLNFLGEAIAFISDSMMQFNVAAALGSLLITMLFIRPSFKNTKARTTGILVYFLYLAAAGYQSIQGMDFPETLNYVTPTSIALLSLVCALFSAFSRINKLHNAELDHAIEESKTRAPFEKEEEQKTEKVIYPTITPFEMKPAGKSKPVYEKPISLFNDNDLEEQMKQLASISPVETSPAPSLEERMKDILKTENKEPKKAVIESPGKVEVPEKVELPEKSNLLDSLQADSISETELLKMQLASKLKKGKSSSRLAKKQRSAFSSPVSENKKRPTIKLKEESKKNGVAKPESDKSSEGQVKLSLKKNQGLTKSPF